MLLQVRAGHSREGEHRPRFKSRDLGDSLMDDLWQAGKGCQAGRPPSPTRTNAEERNKWLQSEPAATAALPRVIMKSQISERTCVCH